MRPSLPPFTEVRLEVKQCPTANCAKVDPAYGAGAANALALAPFEGPAEYHATAYDSDDPHGACRRAQFRKLTQPRRLFHV